MKTQVHAQRVAPRSEPPGKKKKDKTLDDVLAGKRVLCLVIARALAPPGAYVYETTDGLRVRVFYGRRRRSSSAMLKIGRGLAIKLCLQWAWQVHQNDIGANPCPWDLSKLKISR